MTEPAATIDELLPTGATTLQYDVGKRRIDQVVSGKVPLNTPRNS
jgi:hypothetical protein